MIQQNVLMKFFANLRKMKNSKSIKLNAILNGLRTVLNLIFPLITFPYVSRILSVNEIGKYNFSNTIVYYFLLIAALGIDKYAIREGTKYRDDKDKFNKFVNEIFSLNIFSTVLAYILLFTFLFLSKKLQNYTICILIFSVQLIFTTIGTEWIYSIYEDYKYITIRSIVFKIISLICLFLFVTKGDYLKYASVTVFAVVGSNIFNYLNARKYCQLHFTFSIKLKKILPPILIIFASNLAIQIYVSLDMTMLGYMKSDYIVGIYSVSTKIYTIIKSVLSSVLVVTIPRLALYVGNNLHNSYRQLFNKVMNFLIILVVPSIIGIILLSKNIIIILSGNSYIESQTSLCILSIAIFFSLFSTLFNQCVLLLFGREKVFLKSSIISALINVCLNLILIPLFSENGAAITTLLSEIIMTAMNYYGCKDILDDILIKKSILKNTLITIVGSTSIIFLWIILNRLINMNIYLKSCIFIFSAVILYISILIILKSDILYDLNIKRRKLDD